MASSRYSDEFIADLNRTLTRARLSRYLAATNGNLEHALRLYEKNIAVSEALFGLLHSLEVTVRNSLHQVLSTDIGVEDWYHDGLALPFNQSRRLVFTGPMRRIVEKGREHAGPKAPVGKLVAELTFGFWPLLISGHFHQLWSASAHAAFPNARSPRTTVHGRLETIQRLRNRIAHHEPILSNRNEVYTGHQAKPTISLPAVLECVSWVSIPTAEWLRTTTRYYQAVDLIADISHGTIRL